MVHNSTFTAVVIACVVLSHQIEELKALVLEKTTYLTESANGQKAGLTIEVMKAMFEKEIRDNIATLQIELAEVVDRLDVSDESFSKMQEEMAGERQVLYTYIYNTYIHTSIYLTIMCCFCVPLSPSVFPIGVTMLPPVVYIGVLKGV